MYSYIIPSGNVSYIVFMQDDDISACANHYISIGKVSKEESFYEKSGNATDLVLNDNSTAILVHLGLPSKKPSIHFLRI